MMPQPGKRPSSPFQGEAGWGTCTFDTLQLPLIEGESLCRDLLSMMLQPGKRLSPPFQGEDGWGT
ncbi:hypothetical protein A11A3_15152 [Alcanivorax hongdengensis A-11-3]|uniref:Uncharacterized protein n=1 Tax=Alcanivorax hongdengensis A-11-3 TaxID=1177179 RepID=L0W8A9_9GAMM|nr:hypothetical protein A11A3_15152 [Alcanivorax hongdengensis A-11-3]